MISFTIYHYCGVSKLVGKCIKISRANFLILLKKFIEYFQYEGQFLRKYGFTKNVIFNWISFIFCQLRVILFFFQCRKNFKKDYSSRCNLSKNIWQRSLFFYRAASLTAYKYFKQIIVLFRAKKIFCRKEDAFDCAEIRAQIFRLPHTDL